MNFIKKFYLKTITISLLNKFQYTKLTEIPKIRRIILNINCKESDLKNIAASLLALELMTGKRGSVTHARKANALLRIRKGDPIGCKVYLKKHEMYNFLEKFLIEIIPQIINTTNDFEFKSYPKNVNSISCHFKNGLTFEIETNFFLFNKIPDLQIVIQTNTTTKEELEYLLRSFKLHINSEPTSN